MSLIIWILLGVGLGLLASKLVSTTGEGVVVDILLGGIGGAIGGWLFAFIGSITVADFNRDSLYGAIAAIVGAALLLLAYHMFYRRRMR